MTSDYKVGYKKPPVEHHFKKGQSGNPNGRPKQTRNIKTDLCEELQEVIVVREGERTTKISKQRAIIKSLIVKAVKGDTRAATTLLNMVYRLLQPTIEEIDHKESLEADEHEVLAALENAFRQQAKARDLISAAEESHDG